MRKYLIELATDDVVFVPDNQIEEFVTFCNRKNVRPQGGEMLEDGQFFYLDK